MFYLLEQLECSAVGAKTGAASGKNRVKRGGSWKRVAYFAARACRDYSSPDYGFSKDLGLRVAMSKN